MEINDINKMIEREVIDMKTDIIASQEQAEQFIIENKVKANPVKRTVCGDGRFTQEQSNGYIRLFGGDEGLLMALKGAVNKYNLNVSDTELVARLGASLRAIRGADEPIGMHTDANHLDEGQIGCGHVARAISGEAKHANLTPDDVKLLHGEIAEDFAKHQVVLNGSHAEKAVLLVHGMDWSVNSFDGKNMYFVIDVDRTLSLIKEIVHGVGIEDLTFDAVKEQFELQMDATSRILAKGMNIFDVNFDSEGIPSLSHHGIVPTS